MDKEAADHLADHAERRLPEAEVADRALLECPAHLLRFHRFAGAEIGKEVVAGLDAAGAEELHESVLVSRTQTDPVVLVMEEWHPEDGGDDPDGRGGEK